MTSVAVLQSLNEDEMTNPQTLGDVLSIIRSAFGCPSRCIVVPDDRKPKVTLLLLDQLHDHTRGPSQLAVDETKKFVMQQVNGTDSFQTANLYYDQNPSQQRRRWGAEQMAQAGSLACLRQSMLPERLLTPSELDATLGFTP